MLPPLFHRAMAEPLLSGDKDRAKQGNLFQWFCSFHFFRALRNFHEAAFLHIFITGVHLPQ